MAQTYIPPIFGKDSLNTRMDEMSRLYVPPQRIMWVSHDSLVQDKEVLLRPGNGQPELSKTSMCVLRSSEQDTASILLDYGRELHGGLKMVLGAAKPWGTAQVRIRFGESVSEACSPHNGGKRRWGYSTNDHAMRDMVLSVPSDGQIEIGSTGFRFVRIDLLSRNKTIRLKEVPAVMRYRNLPYLGSFACSDTLLNRIWETGAYTVHLNMQEYLWDGVKRDRLVWMGDMHPEVATVMDVFGQQDVVEKSIDLACSQYPLPQWMNGISSYSLWYLIIQYEWYMRGADVDFLRKHADYIKGLIDLIDPKVDKNGVANLSEKLFLDWPSSPDKVGVEVGCHALLIWALNDAKKLCTYLGEAEYASKCAAIVKRLKRQRKSDNGLKQAAALMSIAGIISDKDACKTLLNGGAQNFSTFYGYYMLQALAQAGKQDEALDIIRRYWGGMLELGATTFWEHFDLAWTENAARIDDFVPAGKADIHRDFGEYCYPGYRHSFCHGWAAGVTPWLTRHVLGIEVMEPGCTLLSVTPHLGTLAWAEGTYPTPRGILHVKHIRQADGTIDTTIQAPDGIRVILNK